MRRGRWWGRQCDGQLQRLTQGCWAVLSEEPGAEADHDLRRFLILFFGRLLFVTRGDKVHCRFLPLLEDLDEVGVGLPSPPGPEERDPRATGLVPIARRWDLRRDTHTLSDQLASLQDAIDSYPQLDVVWQPYLEEGDEGQPWLVQAHPYFGRSVWRSLGLRQSAVEFPSRDRTPRPDDAYLQAFALKYGAKVYKGARRQVDVAGETASLQALLYSAMQDREIAQQKAEKLSDLEDRLAAAVRRAEEAQTELAERERELRTATNRASQLQGQVDAAMGERDQLRMRAEAAKLLVAETTRELTTLRVQASSVD
ncbi:hypothetical protein Taro_007501 [Colocasia esculenta]|uniref:Uncharacterized protein n=1 Tax=Colocasia esculenta TaxID=4460 RepID=A0A843TRG7_COLES|nr:hypothetical protein [Colocasia esculenta]